MPALGSCILSKSKSGSFDAEAHACMLKLFAIIYSSLLSCKAMGPATGQKKSVLLSQRTTILPMLLKEVLTTCRQSEQRHSWSFLAAAVVYCCAQMWLPEGLTFQGYLSSSSLILLGSQQSTCLPRSAVCVVCVSFGVPTPALLRRLQSDAVCCPGHCMVCSHCTEMCLLHSLFDLEASFVSSSWVCRRLSYGLMAFTSGMLSMCGHTKHLCMISSLSVFRKLTALSNSGMMQVCP